MRRVPLLRSFICVVAGAVLTLLFVAFGVTLPYAVTYATGLVLIGLAAWNDAEKADAAEAELARRIEACEAEAQRRQQLTVTPRHIP